MYLRDQIDSIGLRYLPCMMADPGAIPGTLYGSPNSTTDDP